MRPISTVLLAMVVHLGSSVLGPGEDPQAVTLQSANTLGSNGIFAYGFQSSNGIRFEARGSPAKFGGQAIAGRFAWTAPDTRTYAVQFTADENGYQPIGSHLPTPPPIPYAILRAIDYNDRHPYNEVNMER